MWNSHMHTHIHVHAHIHVRVHTHILTCMCTHVHTRIHRHSCGQLLFTMNREQCLEKKKPNHAKRSFLIGQFKFESHVPQIIGLPSLPPPTVTSLGGQHGWEGQAGESLVHKEQTGAWTRKLAASFCNFKQIRKRYAQAGEPYGGAEETQSRLCYGGAEETQNRFCLSSLKNLNLKTT